MEKKMPKLEAGQMIVVDWNSKIIENTRYIYLGGSATLDIDNPHDRSQPLVNIRDREIVAVYDVGKHLSIENLTKQGKYYNPKLIWEKKVKSQTEIKVEELEETIKKAQDQLESIKKSI